MQDMSLRIVHSVVRRSVGVGIGCAALASAVLAGNGDEFWAAQAYAPATLYRVEWTTGNATPIGVITNIDPSDLALSPNGTLYASTVDELYRVDTTTAQSFFIGTISTFSSIVGLDFGPNGTMYAVNYTGDVMTINPLNANAIPLFNLPVNFSGDIAVLNNTTIYGSIDGANGSDLIRIDLAAQSYTNLGNIVPGMGVWGLDFDSSGNLLAVTVTGDLYRIANYTTSGTGTFANTTGQGGFGGLTSADGGCPSIGAYCTSGITSNGCTAQITAAGTPSASAATGFTISVIHAEPQKEGILFYGINNVGFTPTPWGTGSSFLCVKAPIQRLGTQNTGGTAGNCDGTLSIDWNTYRISHPSALGSPFAAGAVVYAQGWFRDPPSPKTTSLSNGLIFMLCP
jgi:hypothetical protein